MTETDKFLENLTELVHKIKTIGKLLIDGQDTERQLDNSTHTHKETEPISRSDEISNKLLKEYCNSTWKGVAIVSEEDYTIDSRATYSSKRLNLPCIVIDPLDGTANYLVGSDIYAIQMAYINEKHQILWSILHFPSMYLTYYAMLGNGAFKVDHRRDTEQAKVFTPLNIKEYGHKWQLIGIGHRAAALATIGIVFTDALKEPRSMGCAAYHLVSIAESRASLCIADSEKIWDYAPGTLLVQEAGGAAIEIENNIRIYTDHPARIIPINLPD